MVAWKIAPSFAYKTAFVAGLVLIAHSLTNYSVGASLTGVSLLCHGVLIRMLMPVAMLWLSKFPRHDFYSATKFAHRNSLV